MALVLGAKQGSPTPCQPAVTGKLATGGKAVVFPRFPFTLEVEHRGERIHAAVTTRVADEGTGQTRAATCRRPPFDHWRAEQSVCCSAGDMVRAIMPPRRAVEASFGAELPAAGLRRASATPAVRAARRRIRVLVERR